MGHTAVTPAIVTIERDAYMCVVVLMVGMQGRPLGSDGGTTLLLRVATGKDMLFFFFGGSTWD